MRHPREEAERLAKEGFRKFVLVERMFLDGQRVYRDELPESSIPDYVRSMDRLRDLQVRVVHGGHDDSFGPERLLELIDEYLARRGP